MNGSASIRMGEVPVFRRTKAAKASLTSTAGAKDDGQPGPSMITMPVSQNAMRRLGVQRIAKYKVVCKMTAKVVSALGVACY